MSEVVQRAMRTVAATRYGAEINSFFSRPDVRACLVEAAKTRRPPVAAISRELLAAIPKVTEDPTSKRRIGLLIAAILDEEGFEQDRTGVRITDPLFVTGSTYRAKPKVGSASHLRTAPSFETDEFIRMICRNMSARQAAVAIETLRTSFPEVFRLAAATEGGDK